MDLFWAIALSFTLSAAFVRLLAGKHLAGAILDVPNERSLHARPVPRSGGIGLLAAAGLAWLAFAGYALAYAIALAGALAAISLLDDVRPLPVAARLIVQAAAAALLLAGLDVKVMVALPVLLISIMWATNLYNFMDGADGLAAGMTVIGFAGYAVAGALAGEHDITVVSAIVAAAAAGFLVWNFHPARIFLGDCGSVPLGFLAAAVGLIGWTRDVWPWWFPAVLFAPFIVDATLTLLRRAWRGENIFAAHRGHYYQRLIRSGLGQRKTAIAAYGLMLGCAFAAVLARATGGFIAFAILMALAAAFLIGIVLIERYLARTRVAACGE